MLCRVIVQQQLKKYELLWLSAGEKKAGCLVRNARVITELPCYDLTNIPVRAYVRPCTSSVLMPGCLLTRSERSRQLRCRCRRHARCSCLTHGCSNVWEKWQVLLGIRLLGTTFWCGLSNHQAATAQMGTWQAELSLRIKKDCRVPTPLRSTSPFSDCMRGFLGVVRRITVYGDFTIISPTIISKITWT